jgi:pimeloyl-ACP methyl ester carboxylesterase
MRGFRVAERMVEANGVDIWTEDFGDPSDPTILLVMGAGGQAILWPDEFIIGLVAGGKHVIRYDNRDVGQTTWFDFEKDPYTIADMAADAVAVLDAYGADRADIVGASMGGMIVQTVALNAPGRVRTMTSIMSTPLAAGVMAAMMGGEATLPRPEQTVLDVMARNTVPPRSDDERIDRAVEQWRALAGTMGPFDEDGVRERERRILSRAKNIDAANNHQLAIASSPDRTDDLQRITAPALVIHGTQDPILPYPHGEATAKAIPGAKLLAIEGMGHEVPAPAIPILVGAILDHTA